MKKFIIIFVIVSVIIASIFVIRHYYLKNKKNKDAQSGKADVVDAGQVLDALQDPQPPTPGPTEIVARPMPTA